MGTAIKHPVPDRVKPSFVIFDIRAVWRSQLADNEVELRRVGGVYAPVVSRDPVSNFLRQS